MNSELFGQVEAIRDGLIRDQDAIRGVLGDAISEASRMKETAAEAIKLVEDALIAFIRGWAGPEIRVLLIT